MAQEFVVKIDGLDKLSKKVSKATLGKAVNRGIQAATIKVEQEVKQGTPRKTGFLKGSIKSEVRGAGIKTVGRVGTDLAYAPPVEFGTKAHEIRPRTKKALYWRGARHPVKSVQHPGTKGKHMFEKGLKEVDVSKYVGKALEQQW